MGSIGSKLPPNPIENSIGEDAEVDDEKGIILPTTPIITPKVSRKKLEKDALDPRSPSKHFARTPLELLSEAATRLSTLAINSDELPREPVETPLKRHVILGIDPRSPTLELQRTPIIVPKEEPSTKIKNKNLEKVKNSALLSSPPQNVPPKLLESNLVTPKIKADARADAYKRKSFVFLETNVDFTETDLDTVIKAKYPDQDVESCEDASTPIKMRNSVETSIEDIVSEDVEELVETSYVEDADKVSEKEVSDLEAVDEDANLEDVASIDAIISNYDETDEATIVKDCSLEVNVVENKEVEVLTSVLTEEDQKLIQDIISGEECVQEIEPIVDEIISEKNLYLSQIPTQPRENPITKSAPVTPPSIVNVTPKKCISQPITPPFVNLTANVEELNKKLTNLIYEDNDMVVFPRVVKPKDQSRTPLAQRNTNENCKVPQKLKVSDKPRKGEYTVNSKIPVFKDKKIKVQCENTPPRNMRVAKPKKSQWDAKDDTMVI